LGGAGKRIIHILDLIFPGPRNADPASEKPPGWSLRQENRARLKDRFKAEVWNERTSHMEAHAKTKLIISPALGEILERRRILEEDLQKVVYYAEKTGNKFENVETGRFKASYKPYRATFWVEYGPSENGFIVYNAYSHRMEAIQA
ncbi:MAG TPA: amine oxidase, partial [Desulfobacteria bacterium]|nr:amine oxidase [Desulfobacteria bacterium]